MDSTHWDPFDCQGYLNVSCRSNNCTGHFQHYDYFCHGTDTIEEDSLNEKSCLQVLRILMQKADEDIIKLEDDILMLQCQLAWDDQGWSKICSVVLKHRIQYLDEYLQSSTKEVNDARTSGTGSVDPGKLMQKMHDLVKPLLEKFVLEKSKQPDSSVMKLYTSPSGGSQKKKLAANTSKPKKKVAAKKQTSQTRKPSQLELKERKATIPKPKQKPSAKKTSMKKPRGMKTLSNLELEGCRRNTPETASTLVSVEKAELVIQKKEDTIRMSTEYPPQFVTKNSFEEDTSQPRRKTGMKMQNSALSMTGERNITEFQEPSNSILKGLSPSGIRTAGSGRRAMMRNAEVISTSKVHGLQEIKVTDSPLASEKMGLKITERVEPAGVISDSLTVCGNIYSEDLIKTRETRAYRHAINKEVFCKEPLVVYKRKISQGLEKKEPPGTGPSESDDTDSDSLTDSDPLFEIRDVKRRKPSKPNKKMKDKPQMQQILEIENVGVNSIKPNYPVKPEQEHGKIYERDREMVPRMCTPNGSDLESSSGDTLNRHQKEAFDMTSKNSSKEIEQELSWMEKDDASEVTLTSVSS